MGEAATRLKLIEPATRIRASPVRPFAVSPARLLGSFICYSRRATDSITVLRYYHANYHLQGYTGGSRFAPRPS